MFGSLENEIYFYAMNAKQLQKRHEKAQEELKAVAIPIIAKSSAKRECEKVAKKLDVSYQTVINYVYGMAKDGFLTEAIRDVFQTL